MNTHYVSHELRTKLHDIIESYHLDNPDGRDSHHEMMNFLIDVVNEDTGEGEDALDMEGGIDAHYSHCVELRNQLLAAL